MYITPTSYIHKNYNEYTAKVRNYNTRAGQNLKANSCDTVSFTGVKIVDPKVLKNKFTILLSQDRWAEKLDIKMPESEAEKEALLEFLTNRKALDSYVHLTNEKARILFHRNWLSHVKVKDPTNPYIKDSQQELAKRGNIEAVLNTLDKKIALAKAKNKSAIEYFENLDKLEEEYSASKIIKNNEISKIWYQIRKNNINKDHKYTTQELIDIVKGEKSIEKTDTTEQIVKPAKKKITRKDVISEVSEKYENFLRENLSIYLQNYNEANIEGHRIINEYLKKYNWAFPGIKKQLIRTIEEHIRKYNFKVESLGEASYYRLDERHVELLAGLKHIKNKRTELAALKKTAKKNKDDKKAQSTVTKAEKNLAKFQREWIKALKEGVEAEAANREMFVSKGKGEYYDYLMGKNKNVIAYKKIYALIKENKGKLPEDAWQNLLSE